MRTLTLLTLSGLMQAAAPPKGPRYTAALGKADDRIEQVVGKAGPIFRITSKSGIGSIVLTRTEGPPPSQVTFDLIGLRTLEGLTLTDGPQKMSASLPRGAPRAAFWFDKAGKPTRDPKATALTLTLTKKPGRPIVEVVAAYAPGIAPSARCTLAWVNEYRR